MIISLIINLAACGLYSSTVRWPERAALAAFFVAFFLFTFRVANRKKKNFRGKEIMEASFFMKRLSPSRESHAMSQK